MNVYVITGEGAQPAEGTVSHEGCLLVFLAKPAVGLVPRLLLLLLYLNVRVPLVRRSAATVLCGGVLLGCGLVLRAFPRCFSLIRPSSFEHTKFFF